MKRYTDHLCISIECEDAELPMAIAQLGQVIKIEMSGAQMQLGNTNVPQLANMKQAELLPASNVSTGHLLNNRSKRNG